MVKDRRVHCKVVLHWKFMIENKCQVLHNTNTNLLTHMWGSKS